MTEGQNVVPVLCGGCGEKLAYVTVPLNHHSKYKCLNGDCERD